MRLVIQTEPTATYWRERADPAWTELRWRTLSSVGPVTFADGESPSVTVTVGLSAQHIAAPPVGVRASLYNGDNLLIDGTIQRVSLSGRTAAITVEAGFPAYKDPLPLRETTDWGEYQQAEVIPHVYGTAWVDPLPYSTDRRVFVLADHVCAGVLAVRRGGVTTTAFAHYPGSDSSGHTVHFLELAQPLGDGEELEAQVRGKLDNAGAVIETAAAVLGDMLELSGAEHALPYDLPDYRLAGVVDDGTRSLHSWLSEVCESVGWVWNAGAKVGAINPDAVPSELIAATHASEVEADALYPVVGLARITYASGDGALLLTARNGSAVEVDWDLGWLTTARDALTVGTALLQRHGRTGWIVRARCSRAGLLPGDTLLLPSYAQHPGAITGGVILASEIDWDNGAETHVFEQRTLQAPVVDIELLSTGVLPDVVQGAAVSYANGVATITVLDNAGIAVIGATCTLDGVQTQVTDTAGQCQFSVARGQHQVLVEPLAGQPMLVDFAV